jgi:hypothetical protein
LRSKSTTAASPSTPTSSASSELRHVACGQLAQIDVGELRNVGEKRRSALATMGVETVFDLTHDVSAPLRGPNPSR